MTTAAAHATNPPTKKPLFPQPIPIIGGTGEHGSGKTTFGLSLCPRETLLFDTEKSAATYEGCYKKRIDVPQEMLRKFAGKAYKPIDTFTWFRDQALSVKPGDYRVIVLDVANDIETGATDWVRANPGYFSKTAAQYTKMSALLWGDMKELWKQILADIASRCETFYFTVHMGDVFADEKRTGKRKPRGKSTLMELASLYLQFERKADKGIVADKPSATVLKTRLAFTAIDGDGELIMRPYLPPRLPEGTKAAIIKYMITPPDYRQLEESEKATEPTAEEFAVEQADVKLRTAEAELQIEQIRCDREARQEAARDRLAATNAKAEAEKAERRRVADAVKGVTAPVAGPPVVVASSEAPKVVTQNETPATPTPPAKPEPVKEAPKQAAPEPAKAPVTPTQATPPADDASKPVLSPEAFAALRGNWWAARKFDKATGITEWKKLLMEKFKSSTITTLNRDQHFELKQFLQGEISHYETEALKASTAHLPEGPKETFQHALATAG